MLFKDNSSCSCFHDGWSFSLWRKVEGLAFWIAVWMSGHCHLFTPTKASFSPVICRHPKAASIMWHAQTSQAHLRQAVVSASSQQSQSWLPALTQQTGCGYMGKLQVGETKFCSCTDGYRVPLPPAHCTAIGQKLLCRCTVSCGEAVLKLRQVRKQCPEPLCRRQCGWVRRQ